MSFEMSIFHCLAFHRFSLMCNVGYTRNWSRIESRIDIAKALSSFAKFRILIRYVAEKFSRKIITILYVIYLLRMIEKPQVTNTRRLVDMNYLQTYCVWKISYIRVSDFIFFGSLVSYLKTKFNLSYVKIQVVPHSKHTPILFMKTSQLMLHREKIAVFSWNHKNLSTHSVGRV
jgi:diacylglycerol kinase family enzyme